MASEAEAAEEEGTSRRRDRDDRKLKNPVGRLVSLVDDKDALSFSAMGDTAFGVVSAMYFSKESVGSFLALFSCAAVGGVVSCHVVVAVDRRPLRLKATDEGVGTEGEGVTGVTGESSTIVEEEVVVWRWDRLGVRL